MNCKLLQKFLCPSTTPVTEHLTDFPLKEPCKVEVSCVPVTHVKKQKRIFGLVSHWKSVLGQAKNWTFFLKGFVVWLTVRFWGFFKVSL